MTLEEDITMAYTAFDHNSDRSIAGLAFQKNVLAKLKLHQPETEFVMVWDYFKEINPSLTDRQLSHLEKEFGDITYEHAGQRHYIECCLAMGKKYSRLCEMKRLKFVGSNRWYCYGFKNSNSVVLFPSLVWKSYASKIKLADDRSYRLVPIYSIKGLRAAAHSLESYWNIYHK